MSQKDSSETPSANKPEPVFKDLSAPEFNDGGDGEETNATEPVQVESMCVGCGENVSVNMNVLWMEMFY